VTRWHLEQPGAEHRRERQRHETRDEDRAGHGDAEFVEELAGVALQEGERHEDRHQRRGGRHHGEADLLRAVARGLFRRFAELFLVSVGVLKHDDGIIHHDADGDGQCEQGEVVDRVAERRHDREGRDDRGGNGKGRDDGRPQVAQEEEDDHHHQQRRLDQRALRGGDRPLDEDRLVVRFQQGHAGGQQRADARQRCLDRLRDIDGVGLGLGNHAEADGGRAVEAEERAVVGRTELDPPDVAQLGEHAALARDHQVGELVRRPQFAERAHRELALLRLDPAGRHFHVARADGRGHFLHRERAGAERGLVEPDPHRVAPLALDLGAGHPGDGLQPLLHDPVGHVIELEEVERRRGQRQVEERPSIGVLLGDHRLVHVFGEAAANARHQVADVLGRRFDVAVEAELDPDVAALFVAGGGEGANPFRRAELLFEHVRHRRLHHPRVGPAEGGLDRDDRRIDVGKLTDREPLVSEGPEEHQRQRHHGREDGPGN
jgi:hypothetical protein